MVTQASSPVPLVPAHLTRDHPLVTRDYSLYTPPIERMVDQLASWIDNQARGRHHLRSFTLRQIKRRRPLGADVAEPAVQEHRADGRLEPHRRRRGQFGRPVLRVPAARQQAPLATATRSPLSRQHMLMERWHSLAVQGGGRFLVLIIDEAQGMTQREWMWLVELHSLLGKERLRVCVFAVASLQFFDEPIALAMIGGAHVAARFMLASERFHGIEGLDELACVMAGYDQATEWPPHSGQSFTQGVAPAAWAEGLRMEDQAEKLHEALVQGLPPNYPGPPEFPMKTIAHCCRHVLLRIAGGADWRDVTSVKSLQHIVAESGHGQLLALVTATAHLAKRSARRSRS